MGKPLNLREQAKRNWIPDGDSGNATLEEIQVGCLLRIADSVYLISHNYQELINDIIDKKRRVEYLEKALEKETHRAAAYKGLYQRKRNFKESWRRAFNKDVK